jgi:hypothetical protein
VASRRARVDRAGRTISWHSLLVVLAVGRVAASQPASAALVSGVQSGTAVSNAAGAVTVQITMDRDNTAAAADIGWFAVQFKKRRVITTD